MTPIPVVFILPDLGGGGAQKVMLTIAGGLDRSRFAPRILVAGGSQAFASQLPEGVPFESGGARRLRDGLPWLVRRLRTLEPAVAVSVMGYLNLMLLGARRLLPRSTRIVIREANTVASTTEALPRWLPGRALYRALYPRADVIVAPTKVIADEILAGAPRSAGKLHVVPNPVDVARVRASAARCKRHPGPGLRLAAAGRLTRQKGFDRLVELVAQLPGDTHLIILGEGEERRALETQARALGVADRIAMPGFSREVGAWIAGADLFVLPSRWEGLPNVVLESLALGTPAVVSEEAAVGELAAAAGASALIVRPVDGSFAAAIADAPRAAGDIAVPRPSLLPPRYEKEATLAEWERLIERVASVDREQA